MALTASNIDGEALNALRKANILLAENNTTWTDFILNKETPKYETPKYEEPIVRRTEEPKYQTAKDNSPDIEEMIDFCLENLGSASGKKFIKSLKEWYLEKGFLTKRQRESLESWYNNIA